MPQCATVVVGTFFVSQDIWEILACELGILTKFEKGKTRKTKGLTVVAVRVDVEMSKVARSCALGAALWCL